MTWQYRHPGGHENHDFYELDGTDRHGWAGRVGKGKHAPSRLGFLLWAICL